MVVVVVEGVFVIVGELSFVVDVGVEVLERECLAECWFATGVRKLVEGVVEVGVSKDSWERSLGTAVNVRTDSSGRC